MWTFTLFKACTRILGAPISFRSRSASYLRSLDTLNLKEAVDKLEMETVLNLGGKKKLPTKAVIINPSIDEFTQFKIIPTVTHFI